ncbi:hypothetical protein ACUUL3_10560 [Thiovibrio sp. JS02]
MKIPGRQGIIRSIVCGIIFFLAGAGAATAMTAKLNVLLDEQFCNACLPFLRDELAKQDGLVSISADQVRGLLRIEYHPPLREEEIVLTLRRLGFAAKVVPAAGSAISEAAAACFACEVNECGATAAAWKKLLGKFFGSREKP